MKKFKVQSIYAPEPKITDAMEGLTCPRPIDSDNVFKKFVQVKLQCGDLYQVSNIEVEKCAKIGDILISDGKYWTIVEMGEK